ncbi:hypothetical protein [Hahella sp. HN01]|uniref:hypothetical protein n=1 Tax=Hahella sp. HN01 TaxID=2847262 RepID=UPI001C1EABE7|nr:hypothetical protein [Hahella sp. HN01]
MNSFTLYPEEYRNGNTLTKDGISFSESVVVKLLIDGEDVEEIGGFSDALVYFDELRSSIDSSGKYLIFTCANGIAEDGGWEGVSVEFGDETVNWKFEFGGRFFDYTFDRKEYVSEIDSLATYLVNCDLQLAPKSVIFPEVFSR